MLRHYVGNRKKGHIFINDRTGKRLTLRHFEKMIEAAEYPGDISPSNPVEGVSPDHVSGTEEGKDPMIHSSGNPVCEGCRTQQGEEAKYCKKVSYEEFRSCLGNIIQRL